MATLETIKDLSAFKFFKGEEKNPFEDEYHLEYDKYENDYPESFLDLQLKMQIWWAEEEYHRTYMDYLSYDKLFDMDLCEYVIIKIENYNYGGLDENDYKYIISLHS